MKTTRIQNLRLTTPKYKAPMHSLPQTRGALHVFICMGFYVCCRLTCL